MVRNLNHTICRFAAVALVALGLVGPSHLAAQSSSLGSLTGRIVDDRGVPVPDATLTLSAGGAQVRVDQASLDGRFRLDNLRPGRYVLLAEQVGYQPVRVVGIDVVGGIATVVQFELVRRPPPITEVVEVRHRAASRTPGGDVVTGERITRLAPNGDATKIAQQFTTGFLPGDGRDGFGSGANGLAPGHSRLLVDGMEELLLRHPGLPGEAPGAPLFPRNAISQAHFSGFRLDPEPAASGGATLALASAERGGPVAVRPWLEYSGSSLGGAAIDNPADSSASAIRAGATIGGGFRGDSGSWALRAEYRSIGTTTAAPFEGGEALVSALGEAAGDTDIGGWTSATVRHWSGVIASGNVAWQPSANSRITARAGMAAWNEDNPLLASSAANGAGSTLKANDVSGMGAFELWSEGWHSLTRIGAQSSSREWGGGDLPYTTLVNEGLSIGDARGVPGDFTERRLTLGETITFPMEQFSIKIGGTASRRNLSHDWLFDGGGRYSFGSMEDFAAGIGAWTATSSSRSEVEFGLTELAAFGQVDWQASPSFTVTLAARYEAQGLPLDVVSPNTEVARVFGALNFVVPTSKSSAIGPRGGITWDLGARGTTVVRASGGLVPGRYDLALLAEAAQYDGDVTRRRATGQVGWPAADVPDALSSTPITMFDFDSRAPRSFVIDAGLSQALAAGTVLEVSGGYSHTDYLMRRGDLNRPAAPLATGVGGRAIWGELEQHGALIVATPGSNRRFEDFDNVWLLQNNGYVDHRHATVRLSHQAAGGLTLGAAYTWSQTEDNLIGQLAADPADRALMLGTGVGADEWGIGTSDLDIPHRVQLQAAWQAANGLTVAARWRWRSGLPFTPGFQDGVDANGDGASGNDPVALQSVAGLGTMLSGAGCKAGTGDFAGRNSCRENAVQALDVEAGFRLPFGTGRNVMLTLSGFNLAGSATGLVDRAAVLVDPDGTITTDANGRQVLPLVINPHFGELLVRRNDPRTIRLGLRVEY